MQLFGGGDEFAKKKDIANPNLLTGSKDFTGSKWINIPENVQKDKYLDFTAVCVNWAWHGISQYIAVNKGETFTASMYVKASAGATISWYITVPDNETGNYKRADTNPIGLAINATGNWQRTSITFTVTGDSGTIKPRIESTDSRPYWIAGMKLERGTNATPWCPAPEDLAMKKDIVNPNLAYGYVRSASSSDIVGTVKDSTFTGDNGNNYCFYLFPINLPLSRGDVITISAFATLSGPQAADGLYKATVFSRSLSKLFDDTADTMFLKSGIRSSKTFVANQDSDPNDPPTLLIYSGVAGKTAGNTIHVQEVKVERGAVATPWCPAYEDCALKPDYDKLLGIRNLLTDDEMNIANALKTTAAQGAISNTNYLNGVSRFHYKGTTGYEVINWPFKVSPNTSYRMEIVVNSTNELTTLSNDRPYIPWGINSQEDLNDNASGDIGNWQLPLPWSKEISGSITFNSGNYSKLYLISNFGFAMDGIDTDIVLQIKLFRNDSIQTQIDQLRSQIEQLKQK